MKYLKGTSHNVIPAKAGIQNLLKALDSRLRGNDKSVVFKGALKIIFLFFILTPIYAPISEAQMSNTKEAPHEMNSTETGIIQGKVFTQNSKGQKTTLKSHPVSIMIFVNGQRVLTLDKLTDENGEFSVKNIMQDPTYHYALGTMYENTPYVMKHVHPKNGEKITQVEFQIGEGSPYEVDHEEVESDSAVTERSKSRNPGVPMDTQMEFGGVPESRISAGTFLSEPHQRVAFLLSILVLILACYFYSRRKT